METLKTHVQRVLRQELSPKAIFLYSLENGIVGGWVASKAFDGLSDGERVQKLLKLFEKYFNAKSRRRIGAILPFTPLEKKILIDEEDGKEFTRLKKKASLVKAKNELGNGYKSSVTRRKAISKTKQAAIA